MAETKPGLRKPAFTKVDQLRPGTSGHNVNVKIISTKLVLQKGRADGLQARQLRISECIVGDETGVIVFTARNDQGYGFDERGIQCESTQCENRHMYKGSMRLAVDKCGRVEVTEPESFKVKEDTNMSLIEYELVNVAE